MNFFYAGEKCGLRYYSINNKCELSVYVLLSAATYT